MSKFKTENYLGNAHHILRSKIVNLDNFQFAKQTLLNRAQDAIADKVKGFPLSTTQALRALGGYTTILRSTLETMAQTDLVLTEDHGSALIPMTIASVLNSYIPALRSELQMRIAFPSSALNAI